MGKAMDGVSDSNPKLEKSDSAVKMGGLGILIEEHVAGLNPNLVKDDSSVKLGELGTSTEEHVAQLNNINLEKADSGEELGDKSEFEKADSVVKLDDLGTKIEEEMGKVKVSNGFDSVAANVRSGKVESDDSSSDSESESENDSESSSDSSSSSEDDDDDEEEEEVEEEDDADVEEGEKNDFDVEGMVAWSEDEVDDEDGGLSKGPIKSKNELEDLPPVPPVAVSLQPHHHTLPVGVVSSILGAQVIIEGVEQHNPLNEGTIFWITETRYPLGLVDEIFGPVESPYYIIRYNSENEIPEGIKQGTPISFVPEFANHVLKDNLYKKGYDASGKNDEEIIDEFEFSDDEKEAEYRKLQKMKKKRDTNEANSGNEFKERKSFKNNGGGSSQRKFSRKPDKSVQNNVFSKNCGVSVQKNASRNQSYENAPRFIPQFQQNAPAPAFIPQPNVVWTNGMPGQQGMVFPNGMMWPQQNMLPNGVSFPQQFAPNQNFPSNGILPVAQPHFSGAPSFGPWPGPFDHSGLNQQFGVAMPMNVNGQECPSTPGGTAVLTYVNGQQCPPSQGRGRGPYQRGGGRFGRGRGRN